MALAAVRFHPAAAQEAESAYDWYASRSTAVATAFARNYGTPSMLLLSIQARGPVMDTALEGTSFLGFPVSLQLGVRPPRR